MKNITTLLIICIIGLFASCNSTKKNEHIDAAMSMPKRDASSIVNQTNLPQKVDLSVDVSNLSLEELRLYYNYVYAVHGMHFNEADLYAFFNANTRWYQKLLYALWEKDKMPESYADVKLSEEERSFLDKIEKRIKQLKANNFQKAGEYTLGNVSNAVNLFQFKDVDQDFLKKLRDNNFVITTGANMQLFHVYEENDYRQIPNFITTDLYLQAFHMYFSYVLKSLEQQRFIPMLQQLCLGLYKESQKRTASADDEIRKLAEYNMVYYAIPYYLLSGKKLEVPPSYAKLYEQEIKNINAQKDNFSEFLGMLDVYFPYSLFKPRGHYTRKPEMQHYFKAMMWLQTAPFCREQQAQLKQAIFASMLFNDTNSSDGENLMKLYQGIYEPIVFLIGLPDNLSFMDIADFLKKNNIHEMKAALAPPNVEKVNRMLVELSKTRNRIKPQIEISCPDKINFMPQRYLIDNDVLQKMVDVRPNAKKAYPKGLDVFAALGSLPAEDLLLNFFKENENWSEYMKRMSEMKGLFRNYGKWNASVYNKWMESLLEMQKKDKGYPEFMQTRAWGYKNMNTSLASWAELKHDAILYAEQPAAAECGDGGPPPPVVRGYVEPNLKFWNKLQEMVVLTTNLLNRNKLMTEDLKSKSEQLNDYVTFLISATKKELAGKVLSEAEYSTIQYMGSSIEYFSLSVLEPDMPYIDGWSRVEGPDKSIAVVADIYTRNVRGCDKNGILHVATGNANNIYVVVEINGYLYLTKGATFSYYEFVQPLGTRLTDEQWQKMLEKKKAPAIQGWMKGIVIDKEPAIDDRVFYSSGC